MRLIRRPKGLLTMTVVGLFFCAAAAAIAADWKELKGEHFIVYYVEDEKFVEDVLAVAEKNYNRIASDLGYSRYDNFWQWDKRAKIYIYKDQAEFLFAIGKREPWIHGVAIYDKREIISYGRNIDFLNKLLPHELAHLIFRDFVGFKGEVPLWLDEGVAQWEEAARRAWAIGFVKKLVRSGEFIPLAELTRIGSGSEKDPVLSAKLYAQAVTLVGYLIEKHGATKFALLCRQLRDGKSIDEALSFVYTDSISNMSELEKVWIKYYGG